MPDRDYSHRDITDKLGIRPGSVVAVWEEAGPVGAALRDEVLERCGRSFASDDEAPYVVLATVDASTDAVALLRMWRERIQPAGGIWLLTPKRGRPGYVDQRDLIEAGQTAGVVDNKSCSVDEATSAIRFVIRRSDRPA
jgi:Protein of unknown function (DUF3052)